MEEFFSLKAVPTLGLVRDSDWVVIGHSAGGHGLVGWSFMVTQYNPVGGLATRGLCANGEQLVLPLSAHIGGKEEIRR